MTISEDIQACNTGINEIDTQHRHLLDLIERLEHVIEQSNDQATMAAVMKEMDTVRSVIAELIEYVSYHFDTEERYMRDNADYFEMTPPHVLQGSKGLFVGGRADRREDIPADVAERIAAWCMSRLTSSGNLPDLCESYFHRVDG